MNALEAAKHAEKEALARADASGSARDLGAAAKATLVRERAERVHAKEAAEAAKMLATAAAVEREKFEATFAEERRACATWLDALAPYLDRIVALDHELDALVLDVARAEVRAEDAHALTLEHARKLGAPTHDVVRPTLGDARLAVRRALLAARSSEGREDLSAWLVSAPAAWQLANHTAAELETTGGDS